MEICEVNKDLVRIFEIDVAEIECDINIIMVLA